MAKPKPEFISLTKLKEPVTLVTEINTVTKVTPNIPELDSQTLILVPPDPTATQATVNAVAVADALIYQNALTNQQSNRDFNTLEAHSQAGVIKQTSIVIPDNKALSTVSCCANCTNYEPQSNYGFCSFLQQNVMMHYVCMEHTPIIEVT